MKKVILLCWAILSQCNTTDQGGLTPPLYKTWTKTSKMSVVNVDATSGGIIVVDTQIDSVQLNIASGSVKIKNSLTYTKHTQADYDTLFAAIFNTYDDTLKFVFPNKIIKTRYEINPGYGYMRIWQASTDTLRLNPWEISLTGTYY